jgi:hypothetical protein
MKTKLLSFAIATSLSGSFCLAQPRPGEMMPPTVEEKMKRTNEVLQKEVQLSAEQKKVIEQSFKTFFTSEEKMRKENPPPPPPPPPLTPEMKVAMDKLEQDRDETIKKVLTESQYLQYKEAVKKLHPPKPGEGKRNGPPMPPPPPPQQ